LVENKVNQGPREEFYRFMPVFNCVNEYYELQATFEVTENYINYIDKFLFRQYQWLALMGYSIHSGYKFLVRGNKWPSEAS
jgi:hypothetical protein